VQITIKLPKVYLHSLLVVDNMLVVNAKKQELTFIYEINNNHIKLLS
jgi:hypothetical protein